MDPALDDSGLLTPPPVWRPHQKFRDRTVRHVVLFVATIATTTLVGAIHYDAFLSDFRQVPQALSFGPWLVRGLPYSATILAILGCHELGHYFACRYYDVDASLPFFLPVPPPFLTGTLGAFIRIREPIPSKKMLFDIGIAGPIAGFLVLVPALFLGLYLSHVVQIPADAEGLMELGEPLLFRAASWLLWGTQPDGYSLNMHPIAFAAWFGMLATALNLFPIGQLDGGHISYSVLGTRSTYVTFAMMAVAVGLAVFSRSWVVWTVLMLVMLLLFGPRHPRVYDEEVPLDPGRRLLALFALVMFILCFTPAPIRPIELIGR